MPDTQQQYFEENVGRYLELKQRGLRDDMFRIFVLSYHLCIAIEAANHELEDIGLEPFGKACDGCHSRVINAILQCCSVKS